MPQKNILSAALLALSVTAPTLVQGANLGFLDQAPIRFFNAADMDMMEAAADEVLDSAADGEGRDWRKKHGVRSFIVICQKGDDGAGDRLSNAYPFRDPLS